MHALCSKFFVNEKETHTFLSCHVFEFLKSLWLFSEAGLLIHVALSSSLKYSLIQMAIAYSVYSSATETTTEVLKQLLIFTVIYIYAITQEFCYALERLCYWVYQER